MQSLRKSKSLAHIKRVNKIIKHTNKLFVLDNPEFKVAIKSIGFIKGCRKYYEITKEKQNL